MEGERVCPRCRAVLKEGVRFCTSCGERVDAAVPEVGVSREAGEEAGALSTGGTGKEGAAPVTLPPPAVGVGLAEMPPGLATVTKRSRVPLLLGVLGGLLLVAGAVMLVLYLALWKEGGGGTGDPMALARKYMKALEKKDVDTYMACFEEGYFSLEDYPLLEEMDLDPRHMLEIVLSIMDVSFERVTLALQSEEGDEAMVVTTAGRMSVSVMGMEEDVDLGDEPLEFEMTRKGGRWFLKKDPMPTLGGWGMDFDEEDIDIDLDEYDLEGHEEHLPEGWNLEDLGDLDLEYLEELMRKLMEDMEEPPQWEEPPGETVTRAGWGAADHTGGRRG